MVWKKVVNADVGDADHFGGDDLDKISDLLSGVSGVDTVDINSNFKLRNAKLQFRNPADTFTGFVLNPALTADANLQLAENSIGGHIVYVDNTTGQYTAKGADLNNVISASTVAETTIDAALTAAGSRGTVIIRASTYVLSGAFAGFNVGYGQRIIMEPGTIIKVPSGFAGVVFTLNSTNVSQLARIEGGVIWEETAPSRLWTCFLLDSPNASLGLVSNSFERTKVINAGIGVKLKTDGTGWITDCYFDRLFFDYCVIAVLFENSGGSTASSSCMFVQCQVQWRTGVTTHGFKDILGIRNVFLNCYPVDFINPAITSNIHADARFTSIYGGTMTYMNFTDSSPAGSRSFIRDQYSGDISPSPRTTESYQDILAISAPSSPATNYGRIYLKQIDSNNDGLFIKRRQSNSVIEVRLD